MAQFIFSFPVVIAFALFVGIVTQVPFACALPQPAINEPLRTRSAEWESRRPQAGTVTVYNKPDEVPNPTFCSDFNLNATVLDPQGNKYTVFMYYSTALNSYKYVSPFYQFSQLMRFDALLTFTNTTLGCYKTFIGGNLGAMALPKVYKYVGQEEKNGVQCNKFEANLAQVYTFYVWVSTTSNEPVAMQYGATTGPQHDITIEQWNCGQQNEAEFFPPQACL